MVGLGTLLFLLALWYGAAWVFRRNFPQTKWFLLPAAAAGVASVLAMEAGWVVTEVGRQPWIVVDYMKVEDAATGNTGVWVTFVAIAALYVGVAVTLVLVLRAMSRRFRAQGTHVELDGPYGPRAPHPAGEPVEAAVGVGGDDE
jgi:cytochrome d ubiquinol oxidase subunit I